MWNTDFLPFTSNFANKIRYHSFQYFSDRNYFPSKWLIEKFYIHNLKVDLFTNRFVALTFFLYNGVAQLVGAIYFFFSTALHTITGQPPRSESHVFRNFSTTFSTRKNLNVKYFNNQLSNNKQYFSFKEFRRPLPTTFCWKNVMYASSRVC